MPTTALETGGEAGQPLHQLSDLDTQDLTAFQDKRRWFEGKLKLLEALPPIYPFILPKLIPSESDPGIFVYEGAASSEHLLPDTKELRSWQLERDVLEADVTAFDGGDLGRMKTKTREVTLLPLTKSSTHLVEITLDLILLIDRLLTLLRHRSDLLELVALRLQWDALRWRVIRECESLRKETDIYVLQEGQWVPPDDSGATTQREPPVTPAKRSPASTAAASPMAKFNGLTGETSFTPSHPSTALHAMPSLSGSPRTPSSPTNVFSPQSYSSPSNGHLSRLQALSARHRALLSTHLKRSSAVLDRMIDVAGPLKGLGDIRGPINEDGTGGGALPDELLDMQDDLDLQCEEIQSRIGICKQLEQQNDRFDKCHTALRRSRQSVEAIIDRLKDSLSQPASSTQHMLLSSLLQELQQVLPAQQEDARLISPYYANLGELAAVAIADLRTERRQLVARYEGCVDGVRWYDGLVSARSGLGTADEHVLAALKGLRSSIEKLDGGRAIPDRMASSGLTIDDPIKNTEWISSASDWIADTEQDLPAAVKHAQKAQIAIIRYTSAFEPPTSIRTDLGPVLPPDSLHVEADDRVNELLALTREAEEVVKRAKEDLALLPRFLRLQSMVADLQVKLQDMSTRLGKAIDAAAWTPKDDRIDVSSEHAIRTITLQVQELGEMHRRIREGIAEVRDVLLDMGSTADRTSAFVTHYESTGRGLAQIHTALNLLRRVYSQRTTCDDIDREAEALLAQIHSASKHLSIDTVSEADQSPASSDLEPLAQRVQTWSDGIASRLPFVAGTAHHFSSRPVTSFDDNTAHRAFSPIAADLDLVYSDHGATALIQYQVDLEQLDQQVREHINEVISRVQAELASHLNEGAGRADDHSAAAASATSLTLISASDEGHVVQEDVFGSVRQGPTTSYIPPSATTESVLGQIRQIRRWLKSLRLGEIAFPSDSQTSQTPTIRRLANDEIIIGITSSLAQIERQAEDLDLRSTPGAVEHVQVEKLRQELDTALAFLPRLQALAAFAERADRCDEVLGQLMHEIDDEAGDLMTEEQAKAERTALAMREVGDALRQAQMAALAVETDRRVAAELRRLKATWADVSASLSAMEGSNQGIDSLVDDNEAQSTGTSQSEVPAVPSSPATSVSRIPVPSARKRFPSSLGVRSEVDTSANGKGGMRSSSNPFPRLHRSTESARNRTISSSGPNGHSGRQDAMWNERSASLTPTSAPTQRLPSGSRRAAPAQNAAANSASASARQSPILSSLANPRPSLLPSSSSSMIARNGDTARMRKVSLPVRLRSKDNGMASSRPSSRRVSENKEYVADPKSTLDLAVGKIVNKLSMDVPVIPVNIAGTDDWKDQSGRYWIGSQGRAKLCYCRILRSRTVMVRVGGGWMELSRFLMDHFSDSLWQTPADIAEQLTPNTTAAPSIPAPETSEPVGEESEIETSSAADPAQLSTAGTAGEILSVGIPPNTLPQPESSAQISSGNNGPITPVRQSHTAHSSSLSLAKGTLPKSHSRHSLAGASLSRSSSYFSPIGSPASATGGTGGLSGPGTPLVPLHFLRKASESPPVREREKERLQLGRRSILGKEQ